MNTYIKPELSLKLIKNENSYLNDKIGNFNNNTSRLYFSMLLHHSHLRNLSSEKKFFYNLVFQVRHNILNSILGICPEFHEMPEFETSTEIRELNSGGNHMFDLSLSWQSPSHLVFHILSNNSLEKEKGKEIEGALLCQTLWTVADPMDCSLPGSSVHGIFQARVLEWVVISFSR